MGFYKFKNVGIQAMTACVPANKVSTQWFLKYYTQEHIDKFVETTGITERRFADDKTCASDLCIKAAQSIFERTEIQPEEIDMLIFVTQTQDFRTPGSGVMIQDKLGLKKTTLVYDLNETCNGFIHGLIMAYTFLTAQSSINKILLLDGDTLSKLISLRDNSTGMLLGDSSMAAVITRGEQFGNSFFSMNSDGSNIQSVITPGGGFRYRSSAETLKDVEYEDGSIRNFEQNVMQGADVFSFAVSELPRDVKRLLEFAGKSIDEIDWYAFHQANKFMTQHVARKLKADVNKTLFSIQHFGNTAGVSIPLTLTFNRDKIKPNQSILMNAIGAGFLYGSGLINIADCNILEMVEYVTE